jgi:hypothetical protein
VAATPPVQFAVLYHNPAAALVFHVYVDWASDRLPAHTEANTAMHTVYLRRMTVIKHPLGSYGHR